MYLVERKNSLYRPKILLVNNKKLAYYVAGSTSDKANIYEIPQGFPCGILQLRWNGLDIDYGNVISQVTLPNKETIGYFHNKNEKPWTLLKSAIWYDNGKIPKVLENFGVKIIKDKKHVISLVDDLRLTKYFSKDYSKDFKLEWLNLDIQSLCEEFNNNKYKSSIINRQGYTFIQKIFNNEEENIKALPYNKEIHKILKLKVFYRPTYFNFYIPLNSTDINFGDIFIGNIIALKDKENI